APAVTFTVDAVAEQQGGPSVFTTVPGALAAMKTWSPRPTWAPAKPSRGDAPILGRRQTGADGSQTIDFSPGDATRPAQSTLFLTASAEPILPAVATSAYLK